MNDQLGILGQASDRIGIVDRTDKRSVSMLGSEWLNLYDQFHHPLAVPQIKLSDREREVAALIATGRTNPEIAKLLWIGVETIKDHVNHILAKTGTRNRIQIAVWWATTQEPLVKGSADVSAQQEEKRIDHHQR